MKDPELERFPALFRRVNPLPGGAMALRRRLRHTARTRPPVAMVVAVAGLGAVLAVLALWSSRSVAPDRSAAARLFAGSAVPHPEAVALGLADRSRSEQTTEPRIPAGVVFVWVAPTTRPVTPGRYVDVADPRDPSRQLRAP